MMARSVAFLGPLCLPATRAGRVSREASACLASARPASLSVLPRSFAASPLPAAISRQMFGAGGGRAGPARAYSTDAPSGPPAGMAGAGGGAAPPPEVDFDLLRANTVYMTGTVGRDPEIRYLDSGYSVARIPLGLYKKRDPSREGERGQWMDLELWNELAEQSVNYIQKGDRIHIVGWVKVDWWDDKNTGQLRKGVKVSVKELYKVKPRDMGAGGGYDGGGMASAAPGGGSAGFNAPPATPAPAAGGGGGEMMKGDGESLWVAFFNNPDAYWDNRFSKRNPKAPDFKNKADGSALWIDSRSTPPWVAERIASELGSDEGGDDAYGEDSYGYGGEGGGYDGGFEPQQAQQVQQVQGGGFVPPGRGGGVSFSDSEIPF